MNTMPKSLYSKGGAKKSATKKKFKPHMMYDPKTGKGYKAKVMADHTRMKKKGYGHTKPKLPKAQMGMSIARPMGKKRKTLKDPIKTKAIKMVYGKSGLGPSPKMADTESFKKNSKKIRSKMQMGGNMTNPAAVLGYFNDIKEQKLGGQYMQLGGAAVRGGGCRGGKVVKGKCMSGPKRSGNGLNIGGNGKVKAKLKRIKNKVKRKLRF